MQGERADDRTVIGLAGADALPFLQGLVTNDLRALERGPGIVWAALLTPQGKYLADFFVVNADGRLLIDVKTDLAAGLLKRLTMYRLRADVQLAPLPLHVTRGLGAPPAGCAGRSARSRPWGGAPMAISPVRRRRSTGTRSGWSTWCPKRASN